MITKTLIIGASGFLGRALVQKISCDATENRLLYRTERINKGVVISCITSRARYQMPMEEFFTEANCRLEIINCASVRYSKEGNESQRGNFETPKMILENAIRLSDQVIKWIQPESFWQYTQDKIPDPEYVQWKNSFGLVLEEFSNLSKIHHQRVVLPHLFGVNDDVSRFLPKLFEKLLNRSSVNISGGGNIFAIADVADVSSYFMQLLGENSIEFRDNLVIFPYHEITLRDLVGQFLENLSRQPSIFWEETAATTNPTMNLTRDFVGRKIDFPITPIKRSLANVRSWLTYSLD
jgi:nucleoside-diphosphate-sugar epimerase